mmetsp:Transcript_5405/g.7965  ORF Transcript_5405/g.7965 Transcript_5405/m.7965 type:complete len:112 (-) Transcript_5405:1276-1611(-)
MFTTINTKDHASLSPAVKDGFSKEPIPRPFVFLPAFPFVCNPLIRCLFCGAAKTLYHIKIPNIQKRNVRKGLIPELAVGVLLNNLSFAVVPISSELGNEADEDTSGEIFGC